MRGGRSSFAVDSKSFEISVDVFGEKLKGIIVERSRGFYIVDQDGGRKFKLERHANEEGRFLLCYVVDSEAKKYCLVFPEGKGILGVGRWGESLVSAPDLSSLGSWGRFHWNLKEGVMFERLGGSFILIEFENKAKSEKVLLKGLRCFKETFLHLESCGGRCNQGCRKLLWCSKVGWEMSRRLGMMEGVAHAPIVMWSRKDREVVTFDFVSARGAKNERVRGRMSSNWEEVSVEGPLAQDGVTSTDAKSCRDYRRSFVGGGLQYTDYPPCSLFSLGKLDFSSSSTPSGQDGAIVTTDGGSEQGVFSEAVGVAGWGPLRVILVDRREAKISHLSGKAQGAVEEVIEDVSERVIQEVVEERDKAGANNSDKSKVIKALIKKNKRPSLSGLQCETLENLDAFALEVSFTEEKDFVKDDVISFFREFYEHEKTYDNVDCLFFSVMQKMGFGEKWIGWIKWCISTASFSMLVNGTSTGFFQSSRGLRQGDPLSPYLFVIVMEVFSCFLKRAVDGGHVGLRINLEKSELIPVGRVENIDDLDLDFGCRLGSLPSTYLGLPLGVPFKSVTVWDGVKERFRRRAFNDWEVEAAKRFLEWLHGKRVQGDVDDMPKISLFAWEAMWSKALTLDLIQKREWALATRCFMCLEKEEIIDHLLLHCTKTRVLWDLLFNLFGVSWVLPSSIRETLLSWHGSFVGKKRKKACRAAPLFIFWTVLECEK
ncbi:hypothetical protein CK203_036425 [Vitis vinifera]|uniref:Reverse transcriptase zinc-binding domain-containing protein n=1 Tax=Vitis vinifera TaxID=29760 RepID=A0A438HYP7_VITVI|nr:hypothetical protein CK203_036425 [Vitis vinifera]